MSDDTDDFLEVPEDMKGVTNKTLPMNMPAAKRKSAKTKGKNMKLPVDVEVPDGADPDDNSWWPYSLPSRDKNIGRPRIIETPEEFDNMVDGYLEQCYQRKQRPLMTGLYLYLGFISDASMTDYKKRSPEFSRSVTRARMFVKAAYESNLVRSQGSVQGVTFALRSFANADGENDFAEVNKTELTGKDGQPLSGSVALDEMSDIEKASRLLFLLNKVVHDNKEKVIEADVVDDNDDDYLE